MTSLDTRLFEHLGAENRIMDELLELIQQEQGLLVANNIKDITAVIDQKSKRIAELANLAYRRHQTLGESGFQANESGMQSWISLNADSEVAVSWKKLAEKVLAAKESNRTNGLLINTQLNRNQSSLNMLRGPDTTGSIYGPNGQTKRSVPSRNFVAG
ncbi:MAG TPA: flagellar protein FlgN [Burkholderiales bacterium]|nr:flagellar protein FlgN [Burkholderiales bacterium]